MISKLLSIIVPTYNMEHYLKQCLSSLVCDKDCLDKMEILVINDGSTDTSSEIAHQYESSYPETFKVIDKKNGNYGSCINVGLSITTGKYVKILDADDYFVTEKIESFISFLNTNNCDLIISDYQTVKEDGVVVDNYTYNHTFNTLTDFFVPGIPYLQMHAITYRTDLLKSINYSQSEGLSYTDQEWAFSPMSAVNTIGYFNDVIYQYRIGRADQTMDPVKYKNNFWQDIRVVENMILYYKQIKKESLNKPQSFYLRRRLVERIYNIYYNFFKVFRLNYSNEELIAFDIFIKEHVPELYDEFNKYTLNEGRLLHDYHYIKEWRRNKCRPTIIMRFSNIYSSFRKKFQ